MTTVTLFPKKTMKNRFNLQSWLFNSVTKGTFILLGIQIQMKTPYTTYANFIKILTSNFHSKILMTHLQDDCLASLKGVRGCV